MINMWHFVIFVCLLPWTNSQIDRKRDNGMGWDIKLNVPGEPGSDYPTLSAIPRTAFTCAGREPGYYADQQTNCQVFRVCTAGATFGYESFLCPNGTLFNQAVFVCDWWMNVNCEKSQEILNRNNYERFGNLKLGPQLMTDIRKMITHPMRNPYNNGFLKTNFVMTQEYKPQLEQLYPKGALIASQEINTNNIYVPNKGIYRNFGNSANDIGFAASSASPQYISYKTNQDTQRTQFSNSQRIQNSQITQVNPNSHTEYRTKPETTSSTNLNVQRQVFAQYNQNSNTEKLTKFESNKINQVKRPLQQSLYQSQFNNNKNIGPVNAEAKQNLVSTDASPTIISKTIAFKSNLPGNKPGSPKSRITFKTWILKPKNSKLIVEPISYTNKNLIQSASEQVLSTSTPYVYEKPKQSLDLTNEKNGYFYNQPVIAKQVTNNSRLNDSPTTFRPQIPSRLYLTPTPDIITTTASPPYELSTFKPLVNTYLPPTETEQLSRQYLSPLIRSEQLKENGKLLTASSSQTPQYEVIKPKNNRLPNFTVTKQSQVNTNHNNLSFTDELTKEKLDFTVNDIEQDTNKIILSSPPHEKITQYSNNYNTLESNYLNTNEEIESKEELTSKFPILPTKSSKLMSLPSADLQPPFESDLNYVSSNKLSNLPYYREPVNTIERTVSIKITVPEKIANILFRNESNLEDLEVLNTDSSNYLVYANNLATQSKFDLTPIGKLSLIKHSNISNSQDLVFSFLADSLNSAKEYNNIAKQNILSSSTPPQQNYNNVEEITSKISQLTSSQFTNNNNNNRHQNIQQYTGPSQVGNQNKDSTQFTSNIQQNEYQQQIPQQISTHLQPILQNQLQSARLQDSNNKYLNQRQNSNQIYSGQLYQLPVPDVTRDYYNSPNLKLQSNQPSEKTKTTPYNTQDSVVQKNYFKKRPDIEIIPSQQLPFSRYQETSYNQETFPEQNDQSGNFKNLINSGNGITAQVQDSIVGTHPLRDNKLLTYKKDQSYYIFSQLNNNDHENNRINEDKSSNLHLQNDKTKSNAFEFVPSVAYKLNDEKEQQRLLNTLKINNFGEPKRAVNSFKNSNRQQITNVNYSIDHPSNYGDRLNRAFSGPLSYNRQQSQTFTNNQNARIEDLDSTEPNGYAKISPQRKFIT